MTNSSDFRIVPKTTKKGPYNITVFERFFKNFKEPLYYNWILPEEPFVIITRSGKNVLVEKNDFIKLDDELVEFEELVKNVKHVNELKRINDKLKVKKKSYAFCNDQRAVKNTKFGCNLLLDDLAQLDVTKLDSIYYSTKEFEIISYEKLLNHEKIVVVEERGRDILLIKTKHCSQEIHEKIMKEFESDKIKMGERAKFRKYSSVPTDDGSNDYMPIYINISDCELIETLRVQKTLKPFGVDIGVFLNYNSKELGSFDRDMYGEVKWSKNEEWKVVSKSDKYCFTKEINLGIFLENKIIFLKNIDNDK